MEARRKIMSIAAVSRSNASDGLAITTSELGGGPPSRLVVADKPVYRPEIR